MLEIIFLRTSFKETLLQYFNKIYLVTNLKQWNNGKLYNLLHKLSWDKRTERR